jgi:hypothetical protein
MGVDGIQLPSLLAQPPPVEFKVLNAFDAARRQRVVEQRLIGIPLLPVRIIGKAKGMWRRRIVLEIGTHRSLAFG